MTRFRFILIFLISCLFSCSSPSQKTDPMTSLDSVSKEVRKEFQTAFNYLEKGRYQQAIQGFARVIEKEENKFFKWFARFNMASAHLKLGQCLQSQKIFSDLVLNMDDDSIFKAQALLQLHYCHECLGQTAKALIVLQDVEKRASQMDETVRLVEIPARFSILYSQLNNKKKSQFFINEALNGVKKIKSVIKDQNILIQTSSKLFYIMGRSFAKGESMDLKYYLLALPDHQLYLIESYLLQDPTWSPQAEKEIKMLYEKLWMAYKKLPKNKRSIHKQKISKIISKLQTLSKESRAPKLDKLSSSIIKKAIQRYQL